MKLDSITRAGIKDSAPVAVSFLFLFSGVGALYRESGIDLVETILATVFIFAAPLQVSAVNAIGNGELGAALALTLMVNFRFFLMSLVISQYFAGVGKAKVAAAMLMFSASSYTVSHANITAKNITDGESQFSYFLAVAYPGYLVAVLATLLGYLLASHIDYSSFASIIVMILPIHFTALTAKQSGNGLAVAATFLGGFSAPFLQEANHEGLNIAVALAVGTLLSLAQQQPTRSRQ